MDNNFERFGLDKKIIEALDELGFNKATNVQEKVIKEALLNKDLVVKAETGTGKTASFVIPIIEKINWEENNPQALILAPTRELAIQIGEDVKNIGRYKRIKGVNLYGKIPFKEQQRELKGKCHVAIGTPGRVLDHIDRETLDTKDIKYLVIDEADEMLNMGFISQVEAVIRRLNKNRVTMLFSATISEEIKNLCSNIMNKEVYIEIESQNVAKDNIEHFIYKVKEEEKQKNLRNLLIEEKPNLAVIFCRTKENVEITYKYLKELNYSVGKIHGGLLQKERTEGMEAFKNGEFRILIATDVLSRGIDVDDITHVINLDLPLEKEAYVHRTGRTGRNGKKGRAFTFITAFEENFLKSIEDYIGFEIERVDLKELYIDREEMKNNEEYLKKIPLKKNIDRKKVTKGIVKLYFNGGKKKKIRALDFVGTISKIKGISADDIGIIEIEDNGSYVEILNGKGDVVLSVIKDMTIKGKKLRVEKARR